jgi:mannobiose 2-epimerase
MRIDDMRLSQKDLNAPKSMNTHLHILEPYSNLYRVWPDPKLKTAISSLLQIFCQKIYDKNTRHLDLFFGLDWKSQFHEVSFGHDIEGAWLMNEASMLINDGKVSDQVREVSNSLIESTVREGLDTDGSLFYERHGSRLDKDKHWWPQAEAMVGFMESYELHQDLEDLNRVKKVWVFIKAFLKDKENGEWHWRVNEDNLPVPTDVKAGFWKCPYHNSRAMMELVERIDRILQPV